MRARHSLVLLAASLLSAGCAAPRVAAPPQLGPRTWIDAPLDGAVLPLEPYTVIAHAAHPDGIESLELLVNGETLAVVPPASGDGDETLAQAAWLWEIPQAGRFELEVRAVSSSGGEGPAAFAYVAVAGEAPAPPDTPVPQESATPSPTPAAGFGSPLFSADLFYFGSASCSPRQVTVDVTWLDPDTAQPNVVLFYRLSEGEGGTRTEWSAEAMNPLGAGIYRRTVDGSSIPGHDAFGGSWLQVQFVATNAQGREVGRSDVVTGPTLARCGFTLPPIFLRTATPTQELPA